MPQSRPTIAAVNANAMEQSAFKRVDVRGYRATNCNNGVADYLLHIVDAGLAGVICVSPFVFGGRHDMGRLMLVLLIAVTAAAWFARQAILPAARWPGTIVHLFIVLAAALLVLQIVPLPSEWIASLSPKTAELLPLWNAGGQQATGFGTWQTLSFMPHETTKSLAMLLSYGLLFGVVIGRIQSTDDIQRFIMWVAISATLMATFGLLHYFTSDGRFFWFYHHPHRRAISLSGAFVNRNHFANFLVLGVGPLIAWTLALRQRSLQAPSCRSTNWKLRAIAASLAPVSFAIVCSGSRGGAVALLVAASVLTAIYLYRGLVDSRFVFGLAALAVVVVALLSLHGYDNVAQRLGDFAEGSIDELDESGIRRQLWTANIAAFNDHWWVGAGAGSHSEVYPIYLPDSYEKTYTHAENGYLQVASETGIGGVVLLAALIAVCGGWCATCLRHGREPDEIRLFGAAAAGLAASLAHSVVDFVWYIPACMSITIVLGGCLLRLSQLVKPSESPQPGIRMLPRGRWLELTAAAVMIGGWSVHVYVGPAMAAIHWGRYLRASVADSKLAHTEMDQLIADARAPTFADHERLNDTMIRHLEDVIDWDPNFARAHLRLASKYMLKFEWSQQHADNAMGLAQLHDAATSSHFASADDYLAWLERAFGENLGWLRLAAAEARQALTLCPLQGDAYVCLADLCFLDGPDAGAARSYVDQALRVRPYDAGVRYAVGEQAWRRGEIEQAIDQWSACFGDTGPHQLRIVYWLAGRMPAPLFVSAFKPDWRTLRQIWSRYREFGQPQDLEAVLAYTKELSAREAKGQRGRYAAQIWWRQASLHVEMDQPEEALACLERAYACDPTLYSVRNALAKALQSADRFAEAEAHLRWCLARRPADKALSNALVKITKERHAQSVSFKSALRPGSQPAHGHR